MVLCGQLNFTMTYPGGVDVYNMLEVEKATPNPAFSRVGLGHTEFKQLWKNSSRVEFLEYGSRMFCCQVQDLIVATRVGFYNQPKSFPQP